MGHAFNFLHSWDKNRPDALSRMNYDWKYDNRNGTDSFWGNFRMRFDDKDLLHMRPGDRAAVIRGDDPWASGGHLEAAPGAVKFAKSKDRWASKQATPCLPTMASCATPAGNSRRSPMLRNHFVISIAVGVGVIYITRPVGPNIGVQIFIGQDAAQQSFIRYLLIRPTHHFNFVCPLSRLSFLFTIIYGNA
jgi:hypothetical protein